MAVGLAYVADASGLLVVSVRLPESTGQRLRAHRRPERRSTPPTPTLQAGIVANPCAYPTLTGVAGAFESAATADRTHHTAPCGRGSHSNGGLRLWQRL